MKRIAFCLLWLFLALPVHAQEYDYCAGAGGAAAPALTCQAGSGAQWSTTTQDDFWNGNNVYTYNSQYVAISSGSYDVCQVNVKMAVATGSQNVNAKICDTDCASNCVTSGDTAVVNSATQTYYTFTWAAGNRKTATADFKVCFSMGAAASVKMGVHTVDTSFGTADANKNARVDGIERADDLTMTIYYMQ